MVDKITTAPTDNTVVDKINEVIDNMGGTIIVDQTFDGTSANAQSGVAVQGAIDTRPDLNLSNISNTAKSSVVSWSLPSSTKATLTAAFGTYTAPDDGWIFVIGKASSTVSYVGVANNTSGIYQQIWITATNNSSAAMMPVNKGNSYRIYGFNNTCQYHYFYYSNVNESEAS